MNLGLIGGDGVVKQMGKDELHRQVLKLSGHLIMPPIAIKQWSTGIKSPDRFYYRNAEMREIEHDD